MGFGSIVDQVKSSHQNSSRTGNITRFIWHHQAGTNDDATIQVMVTASREVSSTYTVDNKDYQDRGYARITGVVDETRRPWTSSSQPADGQALTAEVANSSGAPDWGIDPTSQEACARLAAYAFTEYGVPLRRMTADNLSGHCGHNEVEDFFPGTGAYSTFCPGHLDIDAIISRAQELLNQPAPDSQPAVQIPDSGHVDRLWQGYPVPDLIAQGTGRYFGSISGPEQSLGGYNVEEKLPIKVLQQRLIVCRFVPGVDDPNSDWADGIYDTEYDAPNQGETSQAVARFQQAHMPKTEFFGQCWYDDWTVLFAL